jgi:hypothetical protein
MAKPNKDMETRSIYIEKELYRRLQAAAGQFGVSAILSKLATKWLNKEIELPLEPEEAENEQGF